MVSPSDALSDELVSHGELMSSLLFTEVLRERLAEAGWFDARSVMRTNSNFGLRRTRAWHTAPPGGDSPGALVLSKRLW